MSATAFVKRRALVKSLAAWLLRWRARCSASRVGVVVCYHRVGDPGGNPAVDLVPSIGTRRFRQQLRHVGRAYQVVSLTRLGETIAKRPRFGRFPLAITFDDDLDSHAKLALMELQEVGLPACFFLSGASLSAPFGFWWEDLQRLADRRLAAVLPSGLSVRPGAHLHQTAAQIERLEPDARDQVGRELHRLAGPWSEDAGMRAAEVRKIADAGFEIGFHTRGHYLLTTLSDARLDAELHDGRDELMALTEQPVEWLAYPHGKADGRVAAAALRAGFAAAFTTAPTPVAPDAAPYLLGRVDAWPVPPGHFALDLARALTRNYPRAGS